MMKVPANGQWQPVLEGEMAERARNVARSVLSKFAKRDDVLAAANQLTKQSTLSFKPVWQTSSLTHGDAGVALAMGQASRVFGHSPWQGLAHEYLQHAVSETWRVREPGLLGGMAGLPLVVRHVAGSSGAYRAALAKLEQATLERAEVLVSKLPVDQAIGVASQSYDAVRGVTGILRYLLLMSPNPPVIGLRRRLTNWLCSRADDELSGYFTPVELAPPMGSATSTGEARGYHNCGLAHGVPGPLAILALTSLENSQADDGNLTRAVRNIAQWLLRHQDDDQWGPNWPLRYYDVPLRQKPGPTRTAWCYGVPGVARAMFLAGRAVGSQEYEAHARSALLAIRQRPIPARRIDSPILCHGVAGLLQIVLRFFNDTGDQAFAHFAKELALQLLDQYDDTVLLGFQDIERGTIRVDSPGFLAGALGPALALLSASTGVSPDWDRVLLLS